MALENQSKKRKASSSHSKLEGRKIANQKASASSTVDSTLHGSKRTDTARVEAHSPVTNEVKNLGDGTERKSIGHNLTSETSINRISKSQRTSKRTSNGDAVEGELVTRSSDSHRSARDDYSQQISKKEKRDQSDGEEDYAAALLQGFESSAEDSDSEHDAIPTSKLPSIPKIQHPKGRLEQEKGRESDSGVIYVGRIPHGFYEHQMKSYFSQFGDIINLRLCRNRKTGRSKHRAFMEFASPDVARIVAATMNNYLMFGHILKVQVIPREQVHQDLFKNANRRFKVVPWNRMEREKLARGSSRAVWQKRIASEERRRMEKLEKLKELGYEYAVTPLKGLDDAPVAPEGDKAQLLEQRPQSKEDAKSSSQLAVQEAAVLVKPATTKKKRRKLA